MPWHDLPLGQPRGRGVVVAAGLAGLLGLLVLITSRGGGNGGGGGASTPEGAIAKITLSQPPPRRFLGNARLGQSVTMRADIPKSSDEIIFAGYQVFFTTKNFQGDAIPWPYVVTTRLRNENTGQQIGVDLIFSGTFPNGVVNRGDNHVIPIATPAGTRISYTLTVSGAQSDSQGNPRPGTSQTLAQFTHPDRLLIV